MGHGESLKGGGGHGKSLGGGAQGGVDGKLGQIPFTVTRQTRCSVCGQAKGSSLCTMS